MANLGTVWHLPANPEPPQRQGMRDPVFPTTGVDVVTIATGNQWTGPGNPGNQLQDGSLLLYRRATETAWTSVQLVFTAKLDNNKYYTAQIPTAGLVTGDTV